MSQYIYIFTNPAMPDWVKIGKTNNIERRLQDLWCTSIPLPFQCYAYMEVPDGLVDVAETSLHCLIGIANDKEKEFFKMSPEKALEYFDILAPNNPLYKIHKHPNLESKDVKAKTENTTFKMLGIVPGTKLYYIYDNSFVCESFDNKNTVLYNGEKTTLSGLGRKELGYISINGWTLFSKEPQGKTLWQLREGLAGL